MGVKLSCEMHFPVQSTNLFFFGCVIQGLNTNTHDAAVIEESNAMALAIVPSGQHSCALYCIINLFHNA